MITIDDLKDKYKNYTIDMLQDPLKELGDLWQKEYNELLNKYSEDVSDNYGFNFLSVSIISSDTRIELGYVMSLANFLQDNITYHKIDKSCELLTLSKFKYLCETNKILDSTGIGYYSTQAEETNISVYPSDYIEKDLLRDDFPYIVWRGNIFP